ncbi:MAG TPA: hypothetical protein VK642_10610 [Burkholderiales bacterium]|nr:hypothetical protein [Burkholderiales bacterium]
MNTQTEAFGSAPGAALIKNDAHQHGLKALDRGKDKLLLDLKAVVEDAQALMKEAVDSSAQGMSSVPAYLEDRLSTVKDHLQQAKSAVEAKAKHAAAATDQYVRDNPWKSVGFATAATICLSVLVVSASLASLWRTFGDKK